MRKINYIALFFIFFIGAIVLNGCSDKIYEMYKSPCACFEEIRAKNNS